MVAGGLSAAFWTFFDNLKGWMEFRSGLHAATAVTGRGIFWEDRSWWDTQLPGDAVRAALQFPGLLARHVEWLQFHFGGLASLVPMAAPTVGVPGGCFALAQAGSIFSTIASQLSCLRFRELQDGTMESDFDVRSICDGMTDLCIVVPPELLEEVRA